MENKEEKTCLQALFPCRHQLEKPEQLPEAKDTSQQARLGAPKKPGQLPWSVFEDVLWL